MFVRWGTGKKYHKVSASNFKGGIYTDVGTRAVAPNKDGEKLMSRCGLPIPTNHEYEDSPKREDICGRCENSYHGF